MTKFEEAYAQSLVSDNYVWPAYETFVAADHVYPGFEKNEWRFGHAIMENNFSWSILLNVVVIEMFFKFPPNPAYGIIVFGFIMCLFLTFISAIANRMGGIYGAKPLILNRSSTIAIVPIFIAMIFIVFAMRSLVSGVV